MILTCILLLLFVVVFLLVIDLIGNNIQGQSSNNISHGLNLDCLLKNKKNTFSLVSLVFFVFFLDNEVSLTQESRD